LTKKRVIASVERSRASSSRDRLSSQEPADLGLEIEDSTIEPIKLEPVQPHLIALPQTPKASGVSSNPINSTIPIVVSTTTMTSQVNFKKPAPWDKNSPSFDGKTASSLKRFIRHCNTIVNSAGITDVVEQKTVLLDYIHDDFVRQQFEKLATYTVGTFEEWCKDIERLYPEIEDMGAGSLDVLTKICTDARKGLTQNNLGAVRRFGVSFSNEAEKLLRPPATVTNKMLVSMILNTLERTFANNVETMMNHKLIADNTVAAPPVQVTAGLTTAQAAAAAGTRPVTIGIPRRGDRLDYKMVLDIAEKIADSWSGRESSSLLSGFHDLIPEDERVQPSMLQEGVLAEIQKEVNEKLETFSGELASFKDSAVVQEKKFNESLDKMENSIKDSIRTSLIQYTRGPPPHQDLHGASNQGQNTGNTRQYLCYFCMGPHLIRDCPHKNEYINLGWLKVENSRMFYGDGGQISKYPEWKSRKDHIDDHYAAKGITKEQARRQGSSPGPSQGNFFHSYNEEDNLDQVYDSRADERLSNQVQLAMMNSVYRPQMQQMFNQGQTISQRSPMVPANQGQMLHAPNQPGMFNITAENLSQLLNLVNTPTQPNSQTETQEQLLSTRSGRTASGPALNF
jgi:hypothetical protein